MTDTINKLKAAATIASVIGVPSPAEAQTTVPETPSSSVEHTITTRPVDNFVMSIDEAEKLPAFGSSEMIEFQELIKQYNNAARSSLANTNVGMLNGNILDAVGGSFVETNLEISQDLKKNPHKAIDREKIDFISDVGNAYNPQENRIQISGFSQSAQEQCLELAKDLNTGSSLARYFVILHESTHKRHDEKVGLLNMSDLDTWRVRKNRLSETVANATEHLAAANMYLDFKSKGVTTLTDMRVDNNGNQTYELIPLDRILDYYPALKDVVTQDGFSLETKEGKTSVIEASAHYWKNSRQAVYDSQAVNSLNVLPNLERSFAALGKAQEPIPYDVQAQAMLKDIYIGGNHPLLDLTNYRGLLDTMSETDAMTLIEANKQNREQKLPQETLESLNSYLVELGITDNHEKVSFLKDVYNDITNRKNLDNEAVQKITNILLKDGGTITYEDGLIETRMPNSDMRTIQRNAGAKAYEINPESPINQTLKDLPPLEKIKVLRGVSSLKSNKAAFSPSQIDVQTLPLEKERE